MKYSFNVINKNNEYFFRIKFFYSKDELIHDESGKKKYDVYEFRFSFNNIGDVDVLFDNNNPSHNSFMNNKISDLYEVKRMGEEYVEQIGADEDPRCGTYFPLATIYHYSVKGTSNRLVALKSFFENILVWNDEIKKCLLDTTLCSEDFRSNVGILSSFIGRAIGNIKIPKILYTKDAAVALFLRSFLKKEDVESIEAFLLSKHPRVGADSFARTLTQGLHELIILNVLEKENQFPLTNEIFECVFPRLMAAEKPRQKKSAVPRCVVQ